MGVMEISDIPGFRDTFNGPRYLEDDEKQTVRINPPNGRGNPNSFIVNEPSLHSPSPAASHNRSHPVTKYCFDKPRLNGLWKHGRGISAGIGLAEQALVTRIINAPNTP